MSEIHDRPLGRAMALRAVRAEERPVAILGLVTAGTVEQCLAALQLWRERQWIAALEPGDQLHARFVMLCRGGLDLPQPDARKGNMIHLRRPSDPALVLDMAPAARGDVGVKDSRLALENCDVVGVTDDAVLRFNARHARVASRAVVLEEGVALR